MVHLRFVLHVRNRPAITQAELVRNSRRCLMRAAGDQAPRNISPTTACTSTRRSMDKAALVKDVTPLPAGIRQHQGKASRMKPRRSSARPDRPLSRHRYLDVSQRKMADRGRSNVSLLRRPGAGKGGTEEIWRIRRDLRAGAWSDTDRLCPRAIGYTHSVGTDRRMSWSRNQATFSFARAVKGGVCSGGPITARSMP